MYSTDPKLQQTLKSLWKLEKIILDTLEFNQVVEKIVNSMLVELGYLNLGYRIIVLILHDPKENSLKRVSLSQTEEATKLLSTTTIPFPKMDIPLTAENNLCVKAFKEQTMLHTIYWPDILTPPFDKVNAENYQKLAGIHTSMVFPVVVKNTSLGVLIFSMVKPFDQVSSEEMDLIKGFTDVVGIAVQNAKLYSEVEKTTEGLNKANKELHELDKLKDEFVSLASHELRTPMTAIRGSLSTILEGYAGDVSASVREFLTAAYNENERLLRLVNNLLNISRIESGRFTFTIVNVNLDKVIEEIVANLEGAAKEKGLTLTFEHEGLTPLVAADEDKVKEVVINLVGNAVKFTHKGGVTVKTHTENNMVVTSITDTGSGIAKEDQELLFKKFSQVRGSYAKQTGGTGLGLYICKIIVEGLGGKIWLESTIGVGSVFYFSLPLASKDTI